MATTEAEPRRNCVPRCEPGNESNERRPLCAMRSNLSARNRHFAPSIGFALLQHARLLEIFFTRPRASNLVENACRVQLWSTSGEDGTSSIPHPTPLSCGVSGNRQEGENKPIP